MNSPSAPRDNNGSLSKIRRYPASGWVAGVCAGIADYFGWSVKLIRVLVILAFVFSGFFPVGAVYLALWFLMDPADGSVPERAPSGAPSMTVSDAKLRFEKLERRLQQIEACVTQEELDLRRQFRKLQT